jgi:hypothetical protein
MKNTLLRIKAHTTIADFMPHVSFGSFTQASVVKDLNLTLTDDSQTAFARLRVNKDGEPVKITPIDEAPIIGGNVKVDKKFTEIDVKVIYSTSFITFITLDRLEEGGYQTKGTFAEDFRIKADYFPIHNEKARNKLSKYHGIGGGHATINITTQEVVDIKVLSGDTYPAQSCGLIIAEDKDTITVSCTFANAGVNTVDLIK